MNNQTEVVIQVIQKPNIDDFKEIDNFIDFVQYPVQVNSIWYSNYFKFFHPKTLFLKCKNSHNNNCIGILPLEIVHRKGTRFWNHRIMQPFGGETLDFFEPLILPGFDEIFAYEIVNWFLINKDQWEEINFYPLPNVSPIAKLLKIFFIQKGFRVIDAKKRHYYKIDTTEEWEKYNERFLNKKLSDLKNRKNRLTRDGLRIQVHHYYENIGGFLPELFDLYIKRREGLEQEFGLSSEIKRRFLSEITKAYQLNNEVVLSILQTDDHQTMAMQLDFLVNGIRYHYAPTFNSVFSKYSPSKILLYETLKESFTNPMINEFNFMRGESTYKSQFADQLENYNNFKVVNPFSTREKFTHLASKITKFRDKILH